MGLREKKAERTRQQIVEAALDLFIDRGFEQTTMEEIAERADIGSSTLYRYFPSKDLVILQPLLSFSDLAAYVRARPGDEPLNAVLGGAVTDSLTGFSGNLRVAEVRRIVDNSPSPRAKLWDVMATSRDDLEQALAERMSLRVDDLSVQLSARITMIVYEIAAEAWWAGEHARPIAEVVAEVLERVAAAQFAVPGPVG